MCSFEHQRRQRTIARFQQPCASTPYTCERVVCSLIRRFSRRYRTGNLAGTFWKDWVEPESQPEPQVETQARQMSPTCQNELLKCATIQCTKMGFVKVLSSIRIRYSAQFANTKKIPFEIRRLLSNPNPTVVPRLSEIHFSEIWLLVNKIWPFLAARAVFGQIAPV